jgi:hypothetical protein
MFHNVMVSFYAMDTPSIFFQAPLDFEKLGFSLPLADWSASFDPQIFARNSRRIKHGLVQISAHFVECGKWSPIEKI